MNSIPEGTLLFGSVGFVVAVYLVETYLDVRQNGKYREKTIPPEVASIVPAEKFHKSQAYGLDKNNFGFFTGLFDLILGLFALFDGNVRFWTYAGLARAWLATATNWPALATSDFVQSACYLVIYVLFSTILHTPISLYSTLVIEERHGFNKQTLGLYLLDQVKTLALSFVIGLPILALILFVIEWGGAYFFLYAWLTVFVISMAMMYIYPNLIAPLFNKFTPLTDGPLKNAIEDLAKLVHFPLSKLYVVDGSTRSAHSNAYFYGFFNNKRIVLFDTLIKQLDISGVVAVLAHEIGHWSLNHTVKRLISAQLQIFAFFFLFGQVLSSKRLYSDFGFPTPSTFIGLLCFSQIYQPVEHIISLLLNAWSRSMEFEADAYAVQLGFDLTEPLKKIHLENLGNLNPDPLYSIYHFSHPPLLERLRAMQSVAKKRQ